MAIVTFGLGFILYDLVGTYNQVFNGFAGIAGVPQPLNDSLHLGYNNYVKFFAALTAVVALVCWFVVRRVDRAALGRSMRAVREDPVLAGTMVAAQLRGTQSQHLPATIKHFAENNEERYRGTQSSNVDQRTMRELELRAFEIGVEQSGVAAVMCAKVQR